MSQKSPSTAFTDGVKEALPFVFLVVPFALLFGVVATEAGLNLVETMGMTVLVIAGAAQFTAVALWVENAPTLIVILTALAVNLRMALYSAAMAVHYGKAPIWKRALIAYLLVDQSYAAAALKFEREPNLTLSAKLAYFAGVITPIAPLWYLFSYIGAVAGSAIPPEYALDFAVPITFIAMTAPMLRSLPHLIAAITSVVFALAFAWVPYSLGLMIAAAVAMGAGALTEIVLERRGRVIHE
ncbi:AzlC family ABC transporter permease [Pontivivens insulae]|uniref:Inner membrane protein YgaZ n=1 Tax=Pontivivens insulae TaxID=1639689 RepID=A0A2R8A9I1_9RHOB|nr:AzlC family ABC transporter permease [Pontivivens insulae]RED12694.1 putative branched-subunit amino acid permease [Pontivivens insulae]SPF28785.1 Inner membrane protein YgaZ [Pontivivens insulae]